MTPRGSAPVEPGLQQHDLRPKVAEGVVSRARIAVGSTVVEIGPGRGNLTAALLAAGARVEAVELDPGRCCHLRERFPEAVESGRFILSEGDVTRLHPQPTGVWRVVANPPFHLTASLVRTWVMGSERPPSDLDLVLQREAAGKLGGSRGEETRSSILIRLAGTPRLSARLERSDVTPPSRVDLVHWSFHRTADAPPIRDLLLVDALLARAFVGHHTMREALRGLATAVQVRRQAAEQGWDPDGHPRSLAPSAWLSLARLLALCGRIQPAAG